MAALILFLGGIFINREDVEMLIKLYKHLHKKN